MRAREFINIPKLDLFLDEAINIMNPKTDIEGNQSPEFRFFRDQYKKWDKSRYGDLFRLISSSLGYEHDRNFYRLYLPFDAGTLVKSTAKSPQVVDFITSIGFEIVDYSKGIIQKKDTKGKLVNNNIQSVLSKYKKPELEKQFVKDQKESKSNQYSIVLSRHAYDILGMSTNRDWSSCMKIGGHENHCKYLPMDIKEGSLVAYLIDSSDKNINNPIARLTVRPYINNQGDIAFGNADKVYHTKLDYNMSDKFIDILGNHLRDINALQGIEGIFNVKHGLYPEGEETINLLHPKTQKALTQILSNIGSDYSKLKNYPNLDDGIKTALIEYDPLTIQYLDNVTFNEDLDLSNNDIQSLPDNLTIGGSLNISYTKIKRLPRNLTIKGSLFSNPIKFIPRSLKIEGTIHNFYSKTILYKNEDDDAIDDLNSSKTLIDFQYKYETLKKNIFGYGFHGDELYILSNLKNKQLIEWALLLSPELLKYLPSDKVDTKTIKLLIDNKKKDAFINTPSELKDYDLCKYAVLKDVRNVIYVPQKFIEKLWDDIAKDVIVDKKGIMHYNYVPDEVWKKNPKLTTHAVNRVLDIIKKDNNGGPISDDMIDDFVPFDMPLKKYISIHRES